MFIESIICPPTPTYPYHIAAKRYSTCHDTRTMEQRHCGPDNQLTLIFLHSTSFPKEIWEPTIEDLLQRQGQWKTPVREAYAIDCPNHGVAAVLNDGLLNDHIGMIKALVSLHKRRRSQYSPPPRRSPHSRDKIVCRVRDAISPHRPDTQYTRGLFKTKPRGSRSFFRQRSAVIPLFHLSLAAPTDLAHGH